MLLDFGTILCYTTLALLCNLELYTIVQQGIIVQFLTNVNIELLCNSDILHYTTLDFDNRNNKNIEDNLK